MAESLIERPHAAGCVAFRHTADGTPLVLMIKDQYGHWTLPKGHLERGESAHDAALRETREETGVSGELGAFVGEVTYPVTTKKGDRYTKHVAFFLLRAQVAEVTPEAAEGISAADWFTPAEALERSGYPDLHGVLSRALDLIGALRRPSD